jgi:hypothetical protein
VSDKGKSAGVDVEVIYSDTEQTPEELASILETINRHRKGDRHE